MNKDGKKKVSIMINLSLNQDDFIAVVEGLARGFNRPRCVWQKIVYENIHQMPDADLDLFWFNFRRDLWDVYFDKDEKRCGAEHYLHALAALHRGNRSYVHLEKDGKNHIVLCYTFQNQLCPLRFVGSTELQPFDRFIPGEQVLKQNVIPMPVNDNVQEAGKEEWWEDLSIYNKQL